MESSSYRPFTFTIGTLAREAGVNVETVRYYQRRGLLRQPQKPLGGVRSYGEGDLSRLRLIKRAQQLRFTLAEIMTLVVHVENGDCRATKTLANNKLEAINSQLDVLAKVRDTLMSLVAECSGECPKSCPVIHGFRHCRLELVAGSQDA